MDACTSAQGRFGPEIPFLRKFGPKYQICHFKLKFGMFSNSNMENSIMMFNFSNFDWKYPFWVNLVKKIKIVSLSGNLVPTISYKIFETNSSFRLKQRTTGKVLFIFFKSFFARIDKTFILAGGLYIGLSFYGV